jgi:farnesyl-diphosphate farnesyltransferase
MLQQYEMLRGVSRTFALSIEQLPRVLRDSITIAYLMFRVSDCLEDHPDIEPARKAELLRLWDRILRGDAPMQALTDAVAVLDGSDPEVYVAQQASGLVEQLATLPEEIQASILRHVRETSLGMARWQERAPCVGDEAEMDDYMHHVAGLVGYLVTDIFAWYLPGVRKRRNELMPLAREFGLALQTVNVIRGLRKDFERGWVFVPRTFCERAGLTPAQLFDPANLDQALQVVEMLAQKAERHLRAGMAYVTALPRHQHRIRLACIWPLFFAAKTLAVSRNNANVLLAEAKIGRDQVGSIIRDTTAFGWSNHWLQWYYNSLMRAETGLSSASAATR